MKYNHHAVALLPLPACGEREKQAAAQTSSKHALASLQCIGGGLETFVNTRCKGEKNVIEIG